MKAPVETRIEQLRSEGKKAPEIALQLNTEGYRRPMHGDGFKAADIYNVLAAAKKRTAKIKPIKTWTRKKKVEMVNLEPLETSNQNVAMIIGSSEKIASVLKEIFHV